MKGSSMKKAPTEARNAGASPDEPDDVQALKAHRAARPGLRLKVSGKTVNVEYQASLNVLGSTDGDFLEGFISGTRDAPRRRRANASRASLTPVWNAEARPEIQVLGG